MPADARADLAPDPRREVPADVRLRRVRPQDWQALRELRLQALEDTPIGFVERVEDARTKPADEWRGRAARGAEGGDAFQVLAWDGERPVATSLGFEADGLHWLGAVFVLPSHRGAGLVDRLVGEVMAWAGSRGASELRLEVHEDNPRAQAAYRRLGFAPTGRRRPYPLDPARSELEMTAPLPRR